MSAMSEKTGQALSALLAKLDIALVWGCLMMALALFRPWDMANPDAVFAFGMGLAIAPMVKSFAAVRARLAGQKE